MWRSTGTLYSRYLIMLPRQSYITINKHKSTSNVSTEYIAVNRYLFWNNLLLVSLFLIYYIAPLNFLVIHDGFFTAGIGFCAYGADA